jgi:hypothetical protein
MITKTESLRYLGKPKYLKIDELVNLIKFGNENTETIKSLRSVEYKSEEYKSIKNKLKSCIMFHGGFSSISDSGIISLSNYLFYDIDGILDERQYDSIKQSLIDLGVNVIWKSPGGCGLHFLVKCDGLTINNFHNVYNTLFSYFESLFFNVDGSAKGLSRKSYLSTDEDIYFSVGNVTFL